MGEYKSPYLSTKTLGKLLKLSFLMKLEATPLSNGHFVSEKLKKLSVAQSLLLQL